MSENRTWDPGHVDVDKPSQARAYDYMLGGYHNFEVDRKMIEMAMQVFPHVKQAALVNRAFLGRAVRFMMGQGIDQFLDIGSGIPTVGNVHEVAQALNPAARVVYVDHDPIAVAHANVILEGNQNTVCIHADLREPQHILQHPGIANTLDLTRPVGLILVAVLHFVRDDDLAYTCMRALRKALPSGSYVAVAHGTYEHNPTQIKGQFEKIAVRTSSEYTHRSLEQIERFFEGLELVDPGLVFVPLWRPDTPNDLFLNQPEYSINYGGVGFKP